MQPSALIQPHAAALPRSSLASLQCKTASRLQRQQSLGGQGRKVLPYPALSILLLAVLGLGCFLPCW